MLRPGGLVVVTCPNPLWDALAGRLGLVSDSHHVEQIGLARLRELVSSAGFEVVTSYRFMWAPISFLPYVRIPVPPRLALGVDKVFHSIPLLRHLCVNGCVVGRRHDPGVVLPPRVENAGDE
jgi:hypothetical protein